MIDDLVQFQSIDFLYTVPLFEWRCTHCGAPMMNWIELRAFFNACHIWAPASFDRCPRLWLFASALRLRTHASCRKILSTFQFKAISCLRTYGEGYSRRISVASRKSCITQRLRCGCIFFEKMSALRAATMSFPIRHLFRKSSAISALALCVCISKHEDLSR